MILSINCYAFTNIDFVFNYRYTIEIENTFNNGYHQAEEELELSWEDIQKIDVLIYAVLDEEKYKRYYTQDRDGDFYEEVLKRFKSYGKKEI